MRNTAVPESGNVKALMLGNEAIARGALEAGISFAAAYPGTPSTDILESLIASSKEFGIQVDSLDASVVRVLSDRHNPTAQGKNILVSIVGYLRVKQ